MTPHEESSPRAEPAIFLHAFETVRELLVLTRSFPKPSRYVVGRLLDERSVEFLLKLNGVVGPSGVRSSDRSRRLALLEDLSRGLDEIRLLLRLSRESGAISAGQNETIVMRLKDVGRQLGGMIRAAKAPST